MILLSATKSLSFMIKGIYKYNLFGHEVWITTTTISLMVVVVAILIFGVFARRALMKADDNIGAFHGSRILLICEYHFRELHSSIEFNSNELHPIWSWSGSCENSRYGAYKNSCKKSF